jgi:hypothetical protein
LNTLNESTLLVRLLGPAPDRQEVTAYDLGTIMISLQRLFGAIAAFELGRRETPYSELRERVLRLPSFARQNVVQVKLRATRQGSLDLDFLIGVAREAVRFLDDHPIISAFIVSVMANFFTSAVLAAGKESKRTPPVSPRSELRPKENEELSYRILPMLASIANRIDGKSGIASMEFRGTITKEQVEWEFLLDRNSRDEIFRYADKTVAPLAEYRGYLGELSLFNRTGKLRNSFDDSILELAIPKQEMCEHMADYLKKEVSILAHVSVTRDVETRRLTTKYIVHDFRPIQ